MKQDKTAVLNASLVKASMEHHRHLMDVKDNKKPEENRLQVKFKTSPRVITDSKNSTPKFQFNMKK